jgi:hypothetical protein
MLKQYIVADRVNKSAKSLRLVNALAPERSEQPDEGFLANVFDGLRRSQAGAQLQPYQFAEIRNEVLLGPEITGSEPFQVRFVEGMELQSR